MKSLASFIVLFLCVISINAQPTPTFIEVNGTSELLAQADKINFSVNIKAINASLKESKSICDASLEKLLSILKKTDIPASEIDVSPISLGRNYEQKSYSKTQNGFFVSVNVSFVLKDISKYYILSSLLAEDKEYETVNSYYSSSDYETQNETSYENALKAAKAKAEYMAAALGAKIGPILEISENNSYPAFSYALNTITKDASAEAEPLLGKLSIKRSVRVKFGLIN
jgi:uncharacterized protein